MSKASAKRSGIKVTLDLARDGERLPNSMEIGLFRVLQESLTNVHRHSGASQVSVCFQRQSETAILEIRDFGRGIAAEPVPSFTLRSGRIVAQPEVI